jgi:hypothetical protein
MFLPVVLLAYGCKTSSLALMEEHRLWMFKNRILRKKFGPELEELTED